LTNRRSSLDDDALIADFMSFEQPQHIIPKDNHFFDAVHVTRECFKPKQTLYPVSFPDLRYYPWNLKPSAEAPWNTTDFRFTPAFRNVDEESESPKLRTQFAKLVQKVTRTLRWYWHGKIYVSEYIRLKQSLNMIDDARCSFHNLYNEILIYNRTLIHQIKEGHHTFFKSDGTPIPYFWNTLHARSHVVAEHEPDKIRAVFGATKLLLMTENMFIWNLQRIYLNEATGALLWGREIMKGGWLKLLNELNSKGKPNSFLAIDWSQFDKRLLHDLIDTVHDIWRSYFSFELYQPTSFYPQANPRNPQRIERLWHWMCYSIKHTPILLPNGELYKWTYSGFGSGYQQTQLMDSFSDIIMVLTCLSSLGINIKHDSFWIKVQGDDSLVGFFEYTYALYGPGFLDKLAESALFYFNAKLNIKKSLFQDRTDGLTVLGYFNINGFPYRTDEDLLRHLFFPEKLQNLERLAASALGLALAATGCSTRFHSLCEFIWNKLVHEYGITPNFSQLVWLQKTNIYSRLDEFATTKEFPTQIELRALCYQFPIRTENDKQRLWPTRAGTRGRFYFLE